MHKGKECWNVRLMKQISRTGAVHKGGGVLTCPGCRRSFDLGLGLSTHLGKSPTCLDQHLQRTDPSKARRQRADPLAAVFKKELKLRASDELFDLRDAGLGDSQSQRVKASMSTLLRESEEEIGRRLLPFTKKGMGCSEPTLREIVRECLDVFNGLNSAWREKAFMKSRMPYIKPIEHVLGKIEYHTKDLEGFTYSRKEKNLNLNKGPYTK